MEERMGDSFGEVRVHTGPRAAAACQRLDARAFTVGNHVAFNDGEYDPESAEGQHVIAHELAHVRQQTGGQLSMLPQEDLAEADLAVDPDPQLEREAERVAQEAMSDGPVTVNRMGTEIHVQRTRGRRPVHGKATEDYIRDSFESEEPETTKEPDGPSIEDRLSEVEQHVEENSEAIAGLGSAFSFDGEEFESMELDVEGGEGDLAGVSAESWQGLSGLVGGAMLSAGVTTGNPLLIGGGAAVATAGPAAIEYANNRLGDDDEHVEIDDSFLEPLADAVADKLEQRRTGGQNPI